MRAVAKDYGTQLVPWGFNRSLRRAVGKTYEELWGEWAKHLEARYAAQDARVRARGLREGIRLTHHGQVARYPRFVPAGSFPGHEGDLLYFRDDAHSRAGLFALPLQRAKDGHVLGADERSAELLVRTPNDSVSSFAPDGSLVFSNVAYTKGVFPFVELFRTRRGGEPLGVDGGRGRSRAASARWIRVRPTAAPSPRDERPRDAHAHAGDAAGV